METRGAGSHVLVSASHWPWATAYEEHDLGYGSSPSKGPFPVRVIIINYQQLIIPDAETKVPGFLEGDLGGITQYPLTEDFLVGGL